MNINELDTKEIIVNPFLQTYKSELNILSWQVIQFNYNLFILKRIWDFPFDILRVERKPFWFLAYESLFETCIMIAWRLVDPRKKTLTFLSLKEKLKSEFLKEEYREQFARDLVGIKFERTVKGIRNRVMKIRHNRLAHFQKKWVTEAKPESIQNKRISLSKLNGIQRQIIRLFNYFCFGVPYFLFYKNGKSNCEYPYGMGSCEEIESLFDVVAKESYMVNMPESNPSLWSGYYKRGIPPEKLKVINEYRKKFGLPEA